jgi:hypothetical protein
LVTPLALAAAITLSTPPEISAEGEETPFAELEGDLSARFDSDDFAEAPGATTLQFPPPAGLSGVIAPTTRRPQGALTGRIVYMSGGHGWTADQDNSDADTGLWFTQRGNNSNIVEDLGNQDQMTMFAYHCWNAGATVVAFRGIGNQTNEVVIDNDDAGAQFFGAWNNSTAPIYYGEPGDLVSYRFTSGSPTENATAVYTPNIPEAGFYPVYTWVRVGSDRSSDQLYRVTHSGGVTEVRINHRMVGTGWIYLGTHYFEAGTGGNVTISNQSGETNNIFADAIRFGNGMGDIDRGAGVSGEPREDECSRYWVQASIGQGTTSNIYNSSSTDQNDNVSAPPRMAANMNRETEGAMSDRVFLSFHSNASHGTIGLYNGNNNPATATPNQFRWAELIGREINDDLVAIGVPPLEAPWLDQGPNPGDVTLDRTDIEFGEINNTNGINDEFDATIAEVAGHFPAGNDPNNLRSARCREWISRASLQATVRYFNEFGGGTLAFLPERPQNVRIEGNGNGTATLSWAAPVVDGIGGQAAAGYVVYASTNGYGFGNPTVLGNVTSTVVNPTPGQVTFYRVTATNAGGESFPAATVAVRTSATEVAPLLIVDGFDRLDRFQAPLESAVLGTSGGASTYERVKPRLMNSFEYVVPMAQALAASGLPFDSCQNDAIIGNQVDLTDYDCVAWILGEESTGDETFNSTEQTRVTTYLNGGGNLFISGAEVGWDLEAQGTAADQNFFHNLLHVDYLGDDANTYNVGLSVSGIFAGNSVFSFDDGTSGEYNTEFPDRLAGFGSGASVALNYSGGTADGAAVVYNGSASPPGKVVVLGFPLETITSALAREQIMSDVINFFGTSTSGPGGITPNQTVKFNLSQWEYSGELVTAFGDFPGDTISAAKTSDDNADGSVNDLSIGTSNLGSNQAFAHWDSPPDLIPFAADSTYRLLWQVAATGFTNQQRIPQMRLRALYGFTGGLGGTGVVVPETAVAAPTINGETTYELIFDELSVASANGTTTVNLGTPFDGQTSTENAKRLFFDWVDFEGQSSPLGGGTLEVECVILQRYARADFLAQMANEISITNFTQGSQVALFGSPIDTSPGSTLNVQFSAANATVSSTGTNTNGSFLLFNTLPLKLDVGGIAVIPFAPANPSESRIYRAQFDLASVSGSPAVPQVRLIANAFNSGTGINTIATELIVNALRDDFEGNGAANPALAASSLASYLALPSNQPTFGGSVGDRIQASLTLVDQDDPYVGAGSVTIDGITIDSLPTNLLP